MNYYEILNVPINATQREIYNSFTNCIDRFAPFDEQLSIIDAFLTLSDINLRKEYDRLIGLNYKENAPQYLYSYFCNGENYFDINGNIFGNKELTNFLLERKNADIRSSDDINSYYNENEIYEKFSQESLCETSLEATKYDSTNLSEIEKYEIFKKIYKKYKSGFIFSQNFASITSDNDYNDLEINDATRRASVKLLNYKRGVCTGFAALIYEELKSLGIEAYYIRMLLPNWYHHAVLYRVENNWYIADLTNEYLFGDAGYNVTSTKDYSSINLVDFIKNNTRIIDSIYLPNTFGELLTAENVVTLREFLVSKYEKKENRGKNNI